MGIVSEKTQELVRAITGSETYQSYHRLSEEMKQNPELRHQVDEYRKCIFEMQESGQDMYGAEEMVMERFPNIVSNHKAVAYLDAENSLCRMVRGIFDEIAEKVAVEPPRV